MSNQAPSKNNNNDASLLAADATTAETRVVQTKVVSGNNYLLTTPDTTAIGKTSIINSDGSDNSLSAGGQIGQKVMVVGDSNKYVISVAPQGTPTDRSLTLTSPATAYATTGESADYLLQVCNNSDTDMYYLTATGTTHGQLLAKSGGMYSRIMKASSVLYFYCAGTGKVLDYFTQTL